MKRTPINFVLDWVSYMLLLGLISTGLILSFILLPGSRGGHGLSLLGLTRHEWGDIHFWVSMGFLLAMVLHVYMHWNWVMDTVAKYITQRSAIALGMTGFLSIAAVGAPFLIPLEQEAADRHGHSGGYGTFNETRLLGGGEEHPEPTIKGWMSFRDIEEATGLTMEGILDELGIEADAASLAHERAGRFLQQHDLSMEDLRQLLSNQESGH